MVARRGYGGIAILWKKEIDDKIQILNEGNNRVQVIQIDTECRPVCLINIYMPSDSKEHHHDFSYRYNVIYLPLRFSIVVVESTFF
jgi:exonuclease III